MVEFNLLPDVKLQYIRARSLKRVVISVAVLVAAVFFGIFILLLLFVDVAQKVRLNDLSNNINKSSATLKGNSNLNKILTVQNQLKSLPSVESQAPTTSRLFGYLAQLTPTAATISDMSIDLTADKISVTGGADSLATVNQFVDTLKFTTYDNGTTSGTSAFNTVVLSSFDFGTANTPPAQYTITFGFNPTIFSSSDNITLHVPTQTTTRSVVDQPGQVLFQTNKTN